VVVGVLYLLTLLGEVEEHLLQVDAFGLEDLDHQYTSLFISFGWGTYPHSDR
jgi:hypothetical protein